MIPVPFRTLVSYGPVVRACKRACKRLWQPLLPALLALVLAAPVRAAEPVRIVAIGDSLTAGYGLPANVGFLPQLAYWLSQHDAPPVELVNMGVSGDTSAGGRARLDWALDEEADAVILALGGNDVLRGVPPEETRENLDAMLAEITARDLPVLVIGIEAPSNYGPDYKAAFDAIFPELAGKHGALLACWCLQRLSGQAGMAQADGLHPSAAGVAEIVGWVGPKVKELIARVPE